MDRRSFLKTSLIVSGTAGALGLAQTQAAAASGKQQLLELRHYHIPSKEKKKLVADFLKDAAIPAVNRLGIKPVGAFYPQTDEDDFSIYTLMAFSSPDQFISLSSELADDDAFLKAASDYLNTEKSDPAYERIENKLMLSFEGHPQLKVPRSGERIFELRIYESHNEKKAKLKVEMFNEGELGIFDDVGLDGVFYGESLLGSDLPNLTYMLAYSGHDEREKAWQAFGQHPEWQRMKEMERYQNTVSNIRRQFLVPAPYSQV